MITCKQVSTLVSSGGLPGRAADGATWRPPAPRHVPSRPRIQRQLDAIARAAGTLNRAFEGELPLAFEKTVVQRLLS
jgi:hypothetical protein